MEFDQLVKHMSEDSRALLEKAVAVASSRSHFTIEIEHWLFALLQSDEKDCQIILSHFDLSIDKLFTDISNKIELLKTGNDGFPKIGQDITRLLFESWMIASSEYQSLKISSVHIILAAVSNPYLKLKLLKLSSDFERLSADDIREQCETLLTKTAAQTPEPSAASKLTKTPALDQFAINMTEQARAGKFDKILGRDNEIRQMIDILCRRKQNNPILTGEAGVGKTAVVEGLAARLAADEVPSLLKGTELYSLDIGLLQAGAGVKGEFENRLKNVIKDVQQSATPIIMFIDEAHTLIGAGNQAGAGDAANLLKPALARGQLRTIAATTWAEYKKYFESDAALTRRFQVVKVEEPNAALATIMLRSIAPTLEEHHSIIVLDEAVSHAVTLSHRYIAGRQLPDKCVSLLDTACARVNLSLSTKPDSIELLERKIDNINFEMKRLSLESSSGIDHISTLAELANTKTQTEKDLSSLNNQWEQEKVIIAKIAETRQTLEQLQDGDATANDTQKTQTLIKILREKREALARAQASSPLMYECVDAEVVAEVVADWTGIPVGRMQADEIENIMALEAHLEERVVGQPHALSKIAKTMQTARAKLADPRRPLGVFMLVGPSGVGKTETALALAEQLYGSDQNITVINMSEFKEEHKVSLLMGSPPGYVGYGEGGVLTEAVRRKPYSVILLDEIEKAHPGVQDIFYQVFDKGMLRDGEGRDIDFKNTVIIMTSNTASDQIEQLCTDPDTKPFPDTLVEAIGPTLRETYKPAFLGRINIIPYYPLASDMLGKIAHMQLNIITKRMQDNYQVQLAYSKNFIGHIIQQCQQSDTGARQIAMFLNNTLLPQMAEKLLSALMSESTFNEMVIGINKKNQFDIKLKSGTAKKVLKKTRQKESVS